MDRASGARPLGARGRGRRPRAVRGGRGRRVGLRVRHPIAPPPPRPPPAHRRRRHPRAQLRPRKARHRPRAPRPPPWSRSISGPGSAPGRCLCRRSAIRECCWSASSRSWAPTTVRSPPSTSQAASKRGASMSATTCSRRWPAPMTSSWRACGPRPRGPRPSLRCMWATGPRHGAFSPRARSSISARRASAATSSMWWPRMGRSGRSRSTTAPSGGPRACTRRPPAHPRP